MRVGAQQDQTTEILRHELCSCLTPQGRAFQGAVIVRLSAAHETSDSSIDRRQFVRRAGRAGAGVLGSADIRFVAPVRVGDRVVAVATVEETKGNKRSVRVDTRVGAHTVMEGTFTCFILDHHVLDREK